MDTAVELLLRLLQARERGGYVSGTVLAKQLGCSRVNVWNHLKALEKAGQGYVFKGVRNKGYCLVQEPTFLQGPLLRAHLALTGSKAQYLHVLPQAGSTNSEAERMLADADTPAPFYVLALQQSAGRGRLGRVWESEAQENIYLSAGFRPQCAPQRMQRLSLWLGLYICQALAEYTGLPLQLKWPNDIVLGPKKIAGMLAEARMDTDLMHSLVFGIGVNVGGSFVGAPKEVRQRAGTLAQALETLKPKLKPNLKNGGKLAPGMGAENSPLSINAVAALVIDTLHTAYASYQAQRGAGEATQLATLQHLWQRFDCLSGKTVTVHTLKSQSSGMVMGLAPCGGLLVRSPRGEESILRSGEVSLTRPLK